EKVALCMIIFFMCALVAFLTVGLQRVLCPESSNSEHIRLIDLQSGAFLGPGTDWVAVGGNQYRFDQLQPILTQQGFTITDDFRGADLTVLFAGETSAVCQKYLGPVDCRLPAAPNLHPTGACADPQLLRGLTKANRFLEWDDLVGYTQPPHTLLGYNGAVLNVTTYLTSPTPSDDPSVVKFRNLLENHRGSDASYTLVRDFEMREAIECLDRRNRVGFIGEDTVGCVAAMVIQTVSLIVILGVVLARFFMAVWFHWWTQHNMSGTSLKPDQMQVSTAAPASQQYNVRRGKLAGDDSDLYTIMLVTCYSEGEHGIRSTLNSLATTTYPDEKKLLFVVADGQIKGSGNDRHTHDIIIDMMNLDPALPDPEPKSYIAIAHGKKQHNMAKVYAGTYEVDGHRVPMITVVKWGTPAEQAHAKPGNRGKRDSQMVLMNFLSRTLFDDRMTSLDYELFYRIQHIATTADEYESILMVDADTKVAPDSLRYMINAMKNDVTIMGLCGETRIGNKTASFTSAIQVFEYYISHHLGKAFESVFGGVTCLPGCFCMYRIKAPKADGQTVPVLVAPSIVEEYSENIVDTLHKKNLLLLGEDRFLTTLMLRNFPHRKMVFVPQAKCWTIVPDEFKVLLSQRRRWINSTVHNLLELVLVRDLCGTFCFSMQFVVLLELIGTIVLPVAICLTLYLIISAIVTHTAELLPFLMLGAILGLPGFLIIITTRKLVYVAWMLVYLVSLPIWNCILPSYAYWHFDDFSWGETRKVEGELKGDDHGKKEGDFDGRAVSMKKWAEWERDR
ncbi:chitin synthase-domain-containing protein, partial [Gaertneriomyces semiglobifer]